MVYCYVGGDVHGEGVLTHAGAAGYDHESGLLESSELLVEIREAGGDA